MPRPRKAVPAYSHHKPTGQAYVRIPDGVGGRRVVYLGRYNTPESRSEYARLIKELGSSPPPLPATPVPDRGSELSVNELLLAYAEWLDKNRLSPDGKPSRSGTSPRFAFRGLRATFGLLPVTEFGPKALKALREAWVDKGLSRKVINGRVGAVKRLFRWAVSEEIADPDLYQRLQAVEGLRAGQTVAPDHAPVRPASMDDVQKALPQMPAAVRALVLVQLYSAARAGELVKLRVGDIDRSDGEAWSYTPIAHKGTWKNKGRVIYFGERCREVLTPLVLKAGGPDAYVFSPARSEKERNAERSENRGTPRWESHMQRNDAKRAGHTRKRAPGPHYTTATYRRAIERACDAAGVPRFTPHRLRHLAATRARAEFGVDVARALCGHSLAAVTEIYSRDVDKQLALQAVKRFG
jgi:integrase